MTHISRKILTNTSHTYVDLGIHGLNDSIKYVLSNLWVGQQ